VLGGIEDLVGVGGGAETVDLELGDVLEILLARLAIKLKYVHYSHHT
jgi:hypothetical protein